jgi:hypothetical protein
MREQSTVGMAWVYKIMLEDPEFREVKLYPNDEIILASKVKDMTDAEKIQFEIMKFLGKNGYTYKFGDGDGKWFRPAPLKTFMFLTAEGTTHDNSGFLVENSQVIGYTSGTSPKDAFDMLKTTHKYLIDHDFNEIFCYELNNFEDTSPRFYLKGDVE